MVHTPAHLIVGIDLSPPDLEANAGAHWQALVAAAENAGLGFATFSDGPRTPGNLPAEGYRIGAVERAAFVAATTSTLGLVPEVATTYTEPFHVATQISSLDYATRGRAGWLVTESGDEAAQYGVYPVAAPEVAAANRRDAIAVAGLLWDSWEDNALLRERASGRYIDRNKVHYVDFSGEHFSVKGPSILPRSPQGRPLVFGRRAEPGVDVVLAGAQELAEPAGQPVGERPDNAAPANPRRILDLPISLTTAEAVRQQILPLVGQYAGVRISAQRPEDTAGLIDALAFDVLPALLQRDAYHRPYPGQTLRQLFSLERPRSVFEAQRLRTAQ